MNPNGPRARGPRARGPLARLPDPAMPEAHLLLSDGDFAHLPKDVKLPVEPDPAVGSDSTEDPAQFGNPARVGGRGVVVRLPVLGDNYTYLIVRGSEALAVDPGEPGAVLRFLEGRGLGLSLILCTHHHADHTGGNLALKSATGCMIAGPEDRRIPGLDRPLAGGTLEVPLGSSDSAPPAPGRHARLRLPPLAIEMTSVPGHTATHAAYLVRRGAGPVPADSVPNAPVTAGERLVVFTGDCLFPAGCGRVTEGGFTLMWESLRALAALPGRTIVLAGHEYTMENLAFALALEPEGSPAVERRRRLLAVAREGRPLPAGTLEEERRTNPFLRAGDPVLKRALGMEGAADVEVFTLLRKRKDKYVY